ncbi:hypothetical protein ABIB25_003877 [Nakamurella sp. UYEF19]|uniref:hypothetical protein n=1 Tax=Nakamurella sp. UYEF19 TaxID=1756392 RepID=UPI0033959151
MGGDDPSEGVLYLVSCPDAININTGALIYAQTDTIWARTGVAPVAPPPDPAALAQQAAGRLQAPDPSIQIGPNPGQLAVKVPIWLSITDQPPLTLTVAVPRLSVTVTATLTSTTWSMGEPVDPATPNAKVANFTCEGTGTPAPADVDAGTKPPCGYTYIWKSLTDRTDGTGTWPITATTHWTVTWTASDGTNGTLPQPLTPQATTQVAIGEWRSTLVAGG